MADDPRIQRAAEVLLQDYATEYNADHLTWRDFAEPAAASLAAADAVDPLRALLADEDRAVEVIRDAIAKSDAGTLSSRYLKETSVAVLAALRKVANGG